MRKSPFHFVWEPGGQKTVCRRIVPKDDQGVCTWPLVFSDLVLWEAAKATFQGRCLRCTYYLNRQAEKAK